MAPFGLRHAGKALACFPVLLLVCLLLRCGVMWSLCPSLCPYPLTTSSCPPSTAITAFTSVSSPSAPSLSQASPGRHLNIPFP